jgi:glycerol-3-phosphate acyltransferase PlsX
MKTIAFDVMGNDKGVQPAVKASIEFSKKHLDYYLILVGDRSQIKKYTKETEKIKILHTLEVIDKNMNILQSRNKGSSMVMAINLVKQKKADVVISAGSSKHYISLCTIILGRLKNVKRPAFLSIIPTIIPNRKFLLLDVGANLEVTSDHLVE